MAYGIKYRIKYCDKNNVEAKVEIEVRGYAGAVQNVKGTPDVFSLRYDLGGKQNNIISSFADINLFENPITIDDLKTLNETDIRVSFYLANDLKWQGFALPDFFETDIKNNAVISISATDRLSVLKDKTIGGFEVNVTPMRLISEALKQTGLSLNINSIINFSAPGVTDVMRHLTLNGQRLTDDRGRNISAYDILSSLLALFNSYIVQRNNEWYIINKWQLENGGGVLYKYSASGSYQSPSTFTPTQVNFDKINAGGRRKIEAGALEVSLFGEYGGMPIYPSNYDFRLWGLSGFDGWSSKNNFVAMMNENEVTGYSGSNAIIGSGSVNRRLRFKHKAYVPDPYSTSYLESDEWVALLGNEANINISINATSKNKTVFGVGIIVKDASGDLWTQNASSAWKKRDSKYTGGIYMPIVFDDENAGADDVVSISANIGETIRASDLGDDVLSLSGVSAKFVIFGTALRAVDVFVSNAKISISQSGDQPRGTLFKVQQQNDFSKKFDTQTVIFSDYVRSGINGHFYPYRSDDTSIIRPITKFSANGETDYLALLSARQSSRLFSSARDVLTITIDASSIDPLAVYVCGSKKYIATESVFDFFRSKLDLRLEENVVNNTTKKDFVYSYFGEGDDSVRSVGGISGGGTSTGSGGSTPQYWQLDEDGNLFTEYNAYSTQELSAYGLGSGSGGGGDGGTVVSWGTELGGGIGLTVDGIIKTLALKSGLDLKQDKLIAGTGITITGNTISSTGGGGGITSVGLTAPTGFTVSNSPITSNGNLELSFASGYSLPTTAKQGQWDSAVDDKHTHTNKTVIDGITSALITNWNNAFTNNHTHTNKAIIDQLTQADINVLAKLSLVDGNLKVDTNLYSTGEVSAYGIGSGGGSGGGSYERLDTWASYDSSRAGWVLSAFLGNDLNTRVGNLEGGSALTVNTTGTGNAITSLTKSGSVITANKGLTFALTDHTHNYLPLTGGTLTGNLTAPTFIGALSGNASTATTLATARSIGLSGVTATAQSFNGSANITIPITAVPASLITGTLSNNTTGSAATLTTARTLTVGNTGKTFNGSANVSWSLTEIGAASLSQSILAGNGLTGGGTLAADRTITLGTPSNITLSSTNSVTTTSHTHNFTLGGTASQYLNGATALVTIPTVTAGNGMTGGGQLTASRTITLGTPSTLSASSTNGVTASSHTHSITTTSTGAANTIVQTNTSGGTTFTDTVTAPTFQGSIKTTSGVEYLNSASAQISAVGWYRVFVSNVNNAIGSSVILNVNRIFSNTNNESYTFSINVAYNGAISITQLSGRANIRIITKIRVDYVNSGTLTVDIYYNSSTNNRVYISGSGTGQFQAPSLVSAPTGTTVEFDTVNGVKSNIGFTGALTGNASSATKLETSRTIWGRSFNGTGNVSGALTGVTTISASSTITASSFISTATSGFMLTGAKATVWNAFGAPSGGGFAFVPNGGALSEANVALTIASDKNVGLGTNTPSQRLHVVGNILATGEVTAYVASDIRLKENITPITSALDYINRLNPVTYNWNAKARELNSNKTNELDYGLIAQEVEEVLPNIVHGIFDNKYKSIDYIKLIPIMVGAIKELKQEINRLKN